MSKPFENFERVGIYFSRLHIVVQSRVHDSDTHKQSSLCVFILVLFEPVLRRRSHVEGLTVVPCICENGYVPDSQARRERVVAHFL